MKEMGSRGRHQPAPPHFIFEDLVNPYRQPARPWLNLLPDEIAPTIIEAKEPDHLTWTSLWTERPDAQIRFDLTAVRGGTDLR
jgi:hypothetical protein